VARRIGVINGHADSQRTHFAHVLADAYVQGAETKGRTVTVIE
jgi:hypothetical protein